MIETNDNNSSTNKSLPSKSKCDSGVISALLFGIIVTVAMMVLAYFKGN